MIDLHCHILPGLDDGAGSLEVSLAMARIAAADGIRTIVATPHFFRDGRAAADFASIGESRRRLCEAIAAQHIPVEIKTGAEVHVSHDLLRELRGHRQSLVINGSAYLFIEFPADHVYPGVKNLVFELMTEKIVPVIAHPERNGVFARQPALLYDLVQMGALVQANGGSLLGLYGGGAQDTIIRLLEWNLVHFLASDAHNTESLPPKLSEAARRAESLIGKEAAEALVAGNPRAVIEDRDVPYLPPPVDPGKSRKSVSIKVPGFLKPT